MHEGTQTSMNPLWDTGSLSSEPNQNQHAGLHTAQVRHLPLPLSALFSRLSPLTATTTTGL